MSEHQADPGGYITITDGNATLNVFVREERLEAVIPPKCGSCSWLIAGKCRESSGIRPTRNHGDIGCSAHPFAAAYLKLAEAQTRFARGKKHSGIEALNEFALATDEERTWLELTESAMLMADDYEKMRRPAQRQAIKAGSIAASPASAAFEGVTTTWTQEP